MFVVGRMDAAGVAQPLVAGDVVHQIHRRFDAPLIAVQGQDDRQLFPGEGVLGTDAVLLYDEVSALLGNRDSRQFRDPRCRLRDDVERRNLAAVWPHDLPQRLLLVCGADVCAVDHQPLHEVVIDAGFGDDGVVGQTARGVVEGLGCRDGAGGVIEIGRFVHHVHRVAHPDTVGRCARAVGSFHHAGTPGCHDQVGLAHQFLGRRQRRLGDHLHQIRRRAYLLAGLPHVVNDGCRCPPGTWVRRDDDRVSALEREQRLDRRGGVRAGSWDQRGNDPDRLGDLHQPAVWVLLDDADGLDGPHVREDSQHPLIDLDDFVGIVAERALIDGQLGQGLGPVLAGDRPGHRGDQCVHLLLGVVRDRCLRHAGPPDRFRNVHCCCIAHPTTMPPDAAEWVATGGQTSRRTLPGWDVARWLQILGSQLLSCLTARPVDRGVMLVGWLCFRCMKSLPLRRLRCGRWWPSCES